MKKIIATLAMVCGLSYGAEIYTDVDLTPATGTNTAVATYTVTGDRTVFPMALFQTVATQTNTVTVRIAPAGSTTQYTVDTLAAVANTSTLETMGIGDVSADVDPIWLNKGDVLYLNGAGAASSNVTYRLRLKVIQK